MTMNVNGYAALSSETPLVPHGFERRDPRPDDVVIDVLFCGVCHSDLHVARNDWGGSKYPVVPGHEVVGRVASVGAQVTRFKVGDAVGVGCMVESCQKCPACGRGEENYCTKMVGTYNSDDLRDGMRTYGGYSNKIVVTERFVLKMPEGLDLKGAAPLLCAGITTWSPLRHWKVGPGTRLGVVGLGGLGHMALKLGKALGAEVTLFTRSPGKEADARQLGADHIILSTDKAQMKAARASFDLIIDTVPYNHELNGYVSTLAVNGTLVLVGYLGPIEPAINSVPMIVARKSVAGSMIGGIPETQEMLDFCGKHGISADIELISIGEINQAYERMIASDVKYRFVIDLATLPAT